MCGCIGLSNISHATGATLHVHTAQNELNYLSCFVKNVFEHKASIVVLL